MKVLPSSFFTSFGHDTDVIWAVVLDRSCSMPCSTFSESTLSSPQARTAVAIRTATGTTLQRIVLLPGHRDPETLLRANQVVCIVGALVDVDLDPLDTSGELAGPRTVVVAHPRGAGAAHVARLMGREQHGYGRLDAPLADPLPIQVEDDVAPLAEAAAVVGELHADLVLARRDGPVAVNLESLQPELVVAVGRPAFMHVHAPAAERA